MSGIAHKRSAVGMLQVCDSDCPLCAEQRRIDGIVRDVVPEMWLEAVASGERTVEEALRDIEGPLMKVNSFERSRVMRDFTRKALAIKPNKTPGTRRPRGLPSAWVKTNRDIVDSVALHEGLPKNDPSQYPDLPSVFTRVSGIWGEIGIDVTPDDVKNAYYR